MIVEEAQRDIRRAFVGGGPGVFISGLTWLAAATVWASGGVRPAFAILFVGGMFIFPLSMLASRFLFGRQKESSANPLARVALESTIAMIGGLFAAWLFLRFEPAYVFPLSAIAVGTHYAVFRTVYGDILYWLLGALITAVGVVAIYDVVPLPGGPIFLVDAIELIFGIVFTARAMRTGREAMRDGRVSGA